MTCSIAYSTKLHQEEVVLTIRDIEILIIQGICEIASHWNGATFSYSNVFCGVWFLCSLFLCNSGQFLFKYLFAPQLQKLFIWFGVIINLFNNSITCNICFLVSLLCAEDSCLQLGNSYTWRKRTWLCVTCRAALNFNARAWAFSFFVGQANRKACSIFISLGPYKNLHIKRYKKSLIQSGKQGVQASQCQFYLLECFIWLLKLVL